MHALIRGCLLSACALVSFAFVRGAEPPAMAVSPDQAFTRLQAGNQRFITDRSASRAPYAAQRAQTAAGQQPFAIVLTCSDSRVAPELVFNQQLGDLFVIRVAGNVTDPIVLGSIEYAVEHLHAPLVVVLGHSQCGAVQAAEDKTPPEGNLGELIKQVYVGDDLPKDKVEALRYGVRINVLHQTKLLTEKSKVLSAAAAAGKIKLVSGVYSLESGQVDWIKGDEKQPKSK